MMKTMSPTIAFQLEAVVAILFQLWMTLAKGDVSCNSELRATTFPQTIESTNFPGNYPNNIICRTNITSPEGTVIELYFQAFSLEDSISCKKDALVVFDGLDGGVRLLQHACGPDFVWPHYPNKIVSTGNAMTLEFITDGNGNSTGYSATYRSVDPRPYIFVIANPDDQRIRVLHRHSARNFGISPVGIQYPLSVDYDPISEFIFYSDKDALNIGKVSINSFQSKILHSKSILYPGGLRVDVVSRLLYWTDFNQNTVSVSDLDGTYRLTIIEDARFSGLGAIVSEPLQGFIYFTDTGSVGRIWKAEADGSNLTTLVNDTNLQPKGLAIDPQERSLYWIDTASNELQMITVDGKLRSTYMIKNVTDPFAIAVDNAAIFYTDESITFYDRHLEMDERGIVIAGVFDYKGLTLRPLRDLGRDDIYSCSSSPCEEICLPKANDLYTCEKVLPEYISQCPADLIVNGTSSVSVTWNEPAVTSPLGLPVTSNQTHQPGQTFELGAHLVIYGFEDSLGNKVSCTFHVIVIEPMGIFCPGDVEVFVEEDEDNGIVTWYEPVNSMGERATSYTHTPGQSFPLGQTTVTYIFEDNTYCTFTVTISHYPHPANVFQNCPDPILKWIAPQQTSTTVRWDALQLLDDNYRILIRTETSGSRFYVGTEMVSILAVGPSNHKVWCNFTVTVQVDNEPPKIIGCPDTIRRVASQSSTYVEITWIEPTLFDNSGSVYWESKPAEPGSSFSVGTSEMIYVARDQFGNTATCSFQIIVSETDNPSRGSGSFFSKPYAIPLLILIPCLVFILILVAFVIQRKKRTRRSTMATHGNPSGSACSQYIESSQPMPDTGGQLAFVSGGAVTFQTNPPVDSTYDVIYDFQLDARGPPPPYRENY